jgi:hypothetical protein
MRVLGTGDAGYIGSHLPRARWAAETMEGEFCGRGETPCASW